MNIYFYFYVNTARDVVTILLIFAKYLSLYLHIFTCTYRGTHTQAHMYNQHTRGMMTTRHRSLVETGGRKALRVEFLLKTDSGYPKDTGVNKPWQPLRIPSAITPIGQLHQSPPSPIPGDLGRGPSHQSHVLEHRDTYGQAQVCSKGHQGSSVDRPCQPSFHWIKFWHVRNPLPQSIRLRLSVLVRYWAGQGE